MLKRPSVIAACLFTCALITSSNAEVQGDPPRCNDDQVAVHVESRWVCRARNANDGTAVRQVIQQGRSRPMQGGQKPYTGTGPQGTSELRVQPQGGYREGAYDTPQQRFGGVAPQNSSVVPQGGFGFQAPTMTASMSKASYRADEQPTVNWTTTFATDVTIDQCTYAPHNTSGLGSSGSLSLSAGAPIGQYTCRVAARNYVSVVDAVLLSWAIVPSPCTFLGPQTWLGSCSSNVSGTLADSQTATIDNQAPGYSGQRVLLCTNGSLSVASETCNAVVANCATSPASWSQNNITCSGQLPATNHGLTASVVSTAPATTGSASYLCTNGSWSLNAGSTCAGNCPPGFTFDPVSLQCKNDPPDVCLNIPGIQIDIPLGYTSTTGDARIPGYCCPTGQTWNGTMCVAPATDVCPNIPGIQDFVPGAIEVFGMRPTTDGWLFGAVGGVTLCGSATWISNPPMPSDLPGFEYLGPTGFPVLVPYRERIVSMEIVGPWTVSPLNGTIHLVTWPVRITFSNGMSTTEPGSVSRILPEGGTGGGG